VGYYEGKLKRQSKLMAKYRALMEAVQQETRLRNINHDTERRRLLEACTVLESTLMRERARLQRAESAIELIHGKLGLRQILEGIK